VDYEGERCEGRVCVDRVVMTVLKLQCNWRQRVMPIEIHGNVQWHMRGTEVCLTPLTFGTFYGLHHELDTSVQLDMTTL
jgi:hypothetical protein